MARTHATLNPSAFSGGLPVTTTTGMSRVNSARGDLLLDDDAADDREREIEDHERRRVGVDAGAARLRPSPTIWTSKPANVKGGPIQAAQVLFFFFFSFLPRPGHGRQDLGRRMGLKDSCRPLGARRPGGASPPPAPARRLPRSPLPAAENRSILTACPPTSCSAATGTVNLSRSVTRSGCIKAARRPPARGRLVPRRHARPRLGTPAGGGRIASAVAACRTHDEVLDTSEQWKTAMMAKGWQRRRATARRLTPALLAIGVAALAALPWLSAPRRAVRHTFVPGAVASDTGEEAHAASRFFGTRPQGPVALRPAGAESVRSEDAGNSESPGRQPSPVSRDRRARAASCDD